MGPDSASMSDMTTFQQFPTETTRSHGPGFTRRAFAVLGTVVVAAAGLLASGHALVRTDGHSLWEFWVTSAGALLLVVGGIHLLRHPDARSWPALGTGSVLILGVWQTTALVDPNFVRDICLALCAGIILFVGLVFRWQAPVVLAGAVVVLHGTTRFLWPWIEPMPLWSWAAIGGVLVIVLAATHVKCVRSLRSLVNGVASLR